MENKEQMLEMARKLRETANTIEREVKETIEKEERANFPWDKFGWKLVMIEGYPQLYPFDVYGIPASEEAIKITTTLPNGLCIEDHGDNGRIESGVRLDLDGLKEFLFDFPEIKERLDLSEVKATLDKQIQVAQEEWARIENLFKTNE